MKKLYFPIVAFIAFASLLTVSCKKEYSYEGGVVIDSTVITTPALAKTILNQAYGTDSAQKADIYLPAGRTKDSTKTLIILHGGYWLAGDKADLDTAIGIIQSAYPTLNIVNANYRLANAAIPSTQFPAQMTDIQLLLNYLNNNRDSLKISANIALAGVSAGGHLALEYAYAYDANRQVKVVGGIVPPTNFTDPYYLTGTYAATFAQIAFNFTGKPIGDTIYKVASPYYNLTSAAPPTFVSFGGLDPLVPVNSDSLFQVKMKASNITYQYYLYGGEGHDFSYPTIIKTLTDFVAFLKLYL
jgi:acetyl esterase/lipase